MRLRSTFLTVLAATLGVAAPASANSYHAAPQPSGDGDCLTQGGPCSFEDAVGMLRNGDTLLLAAGTYSFQGENTGPVAIPQPFTASGSLSGATVKPEAGAARPLLALGGRALQITGDNTLQDVDVTSTAPEAVRLDGGARLDRDKVLANPTSTSSPRAVAFGSAGVVRDTLIRQAGTNGVGLYAQASNAASTVAVRSSTVIAAGTGGTAASFASSGTNASVTVEADNTILRGAARDETSSGNVALTANNVNFRGRQSDYVTQNQPGGNFGTRLFQSGTQETAPVFVDAANDDFREAPGSTSTIDRGAVISMQTPPETTDLLGHARTVNDNPDIGAYETILAPSVGAASASDVGQTTATITVPVNPNGADTSATISFRAGTAPFIASAPSSVGSGGDVVGVVYSLVGLTPGTTYSVTSTAGNEVGRTTGTPTMFTTASPPPSTDTATATTPPPTMTTPPPPPPKAIPQIALTSPTYDTTQVTCTIDGLGLVCRNPDRETVSCSSKLVMRTAATRTMASRVSYCRGSAKDFGCRGRVSGGDGPEFVCSSGPKDQTRFTCSPDDGAGAKRLSCHGDVVCKATRCTFKGRLADYPALDAASTPVDFDREALVDAKGTVLVKVSCGGPDVCDGTLLYLEPDDKQFRTEDFAVLPGDERSFLFKSTGLAKELKAISPAASATRIPLPAYVLAVEPGTDLAPLYRKLFPSGATAAKVDLEGFGFTALERAPTEQDFTKREQGSAPPTKDALANTWDLTKIKNGDPVKKP